MAELRVSQMSASVKSLAENALWYAWGRIDSGGPGTSGMDSDTAFAFRDWYQELARAYDMEETFFRPGILSEWERWSSAGRVLR